MLNLCLQCNTVKWSWYCNILCVCVCARTISFYSLNIVWPLSIIFFSLKNKQTSSWFQNLWLGHKFDPDVTTLGSSSDNACVFAAVTDLKKWFGQQHSRLFDFFNITQFLVINKDCCDSCFESIGQIHLCVHTCVSQSILWSRLFTCTSLRVLQVQWVKVCRSTAVSTTVPIYTMFGW